MKYRLRDIELLIKQQAFGSIFESMSFITLLAVASDGDTRYINFMIKLGKNFKSWTCKSKKDLPYLIELTHLRMFIWKTFTSFISPWWDLGKIK